MRRLKRNLCKGNDVGRYNKHTIWESSIVVEERLATYLSNNEKLEIMKSNKNTERAMSNGA